MLREDLLDVLIRTIEGKEELDVGARAGSFGKIVFVTGSHSCW
jgi:hypothetical protein